MTTSAIASCIVKNWRKQPVARYFEVECDDPPVCVSFPDSFVSVTFLRVTGHPEWTRVRASNWRYEDEPNGVFLRSDACLFYRALLAAGFVQ